MAAEPALAPSRRPRPLQRPALVDAHVHLHGCYDDAAFLDAADTNMRRGAVSLGMEEEEPLGVLCFTECGGVNEFGRLASRVPYLTGQWRIEETSEPLSLVAHRGSTLRLALIAGRQIVTSERLEVSGLALADEIPDGLGLEKTVGAILKRGGIPVVPWGFGKWWHGRGERLRAFLGAWAGERLFLGDNGGRPGFLGRPREFELALRRGLWILPGSDPLPTPSAVSKVGSYGFLLPDGIDPKRPAASLLAALPRLASQPTVYGELESLARFVRSQVLMRLRK